jgi:2-hydroxychromene-2-carboxylate isomerase
VLSSNPAPGDAGGVFYLDVVSPFAYLLNATLDTAVVPIALERKPVLLAPILAAFGQKGPAEIPAKRTFTYAYCTWLAQQNRIPFQMPAAHPFNPIKYLRLILALNSAPAVISAVFRTLFATGLDPAEPLTWTTLMEELGIDDSEKLINAPEVKEKLRANTDDAIAKGVFGVPTILVDGRHFFGFDALPMLAAYLAGDKFFASEAMTSLAHVRVGATRVV